MPREVEASPTVKRVRDAFFAIALPVSGAGAYLQENNMTLDDVFDKVAGKMSRHDFGGEICDVQTFNAAEYLDSLAQTPN